MSDENVLLEPSQASEPNLRIFSIRRRPRTRKPAKSGPATPPVPERDEPTNEDHFEQRRQDKAIESEIVQSLVDTARGIALVLAGARENIDASVAWNLGTTLESVVEPVDAYYFGSVGELNDAISPAHLEVLLLRKLKKVRAQIADSKRRK